MRGGVWKGAGRKPALMERRKLHTEPTTKGEMMKTETQEIKVGTKVIKDGFEGIVIRVCEWDKELVEVRTRGGVSCVGKSTFDGRYENNSVLRY